MADTQRIEGIAAVIAIDNLDTDQIMPKQFLRGIDKAGLADGLLWDLRFDGAGIARPEFVLNRPSHAGTRILIAGPNFGCGSSREHAVWGLQQYGIDAVIAPSFGEIFYSNAMNNRLLAVVLPLGEVQALMDEAGRSDAPLCMVIDLATLMLSTPHRSFGFTLSERHRQMLLDGLDMIGASLLLRPEIDAFVARHWAAQPWLRDVAKLVRHRLDEADSTATHG